MIIHPCLRYLLLVNKSTCHLSGNRQVSQMRPPLAYWRKVITDCSMCYIFLNIHAISFNPCSTYPHCSILAYQWYAPKDFDRLLLGLLWPFFLFWTACLGLILISCSGSANAHLPACFQPWAFPLNIGLNMLPSDSSMSGLDFPLGYSTEEF